MSAETIATASMLASASVVALIEARIYPDAVPKEWPFPSVAYQRVDTEFETTIHSSIPYAERVTLEVSCMDPDRKKADMLADACLSALGGAGFLFVGRRAEYDPDNVFRVNQNILPA